MYREKIESLVTWRNSKSRKPLIIRGARQTGKTWLMKEFGQNYYQNTVYLNFEQNKRISDMFKSDFNIERILSFLKIESGGEINPGNTLLIFDEIQNVPEAITSLKYFCEDAPGFHIVAAGSLLGVALHAGISFPVGKVEFLDLYPMSFKEFLRAVDEKLCETLNHDDWKLISAYKDKLIEHLKKYYYVGGMPEAVLNFSRSQAFNDIRDIQKSIINSYELDFSKHPPANIVPRIRMLWNSLPSQLAKENRKFIYSLVRQGSRAKEYEVALSWLTDSGQVSKVSRVTRPGIPLKAYEDISSFKLFPVDIGLLCAMTDLDHKTLVEGNLLFTEFKGALTEQYVFQELRAMESFPVYYWSAERATAETDFLIQYEDRFIPVEVKAEENLRSRSLKVFNEKFNPQVSLRFSMSDFRSEKWLKNVPLYAVSKVKEVI